MDIIVILTKPLDAPDTSCLCREVHQDDFEMTEVSTFVFLLKWDAVFLLGQPWSFCMFLWVLPASLEMLQGLLCSMNTSETFKYLDGII